MYCGAKKLPKGKRYGSQNECKRQVRLFGQIQMENAPYTTLKLDGKQPIYCGSKSSTRKHGTQQECTKKRQLRRYGVFVIDQTRPKTKSQTRPKTKSQTKPKTKSQTPVRSSKVRHNAAAKIAAMVKMRKERQKHKQFMKNINAAQHRRRRSLKAELDHPRQFLSDKILEPREIVDTWRTLSLAQTGSGASVALVNTKRGSMVCKFTPIETGTNDPGLHEIKLYEILNNLVDHNVTPFIMKSILSRKVKLSDMNIFRRRELQLTRNQYHALLTESVPSTNIMSLKDYLKKPSLTRHEKYHTVFQVLWTLQCFNNIGFRHNDLHHSNILVVKHKRPLKSHRIFILGTQKFYVPATQYEVRIFDFDRSGKRNVGNNLKKVFQKRQAMSYSRDAFMRQHTLSTPNDQFDTYKFMQHLPINIAVPRNDGTFMQTKLSDDEIYDLLHQHNLNERAFVLYNLPLKKSGGDVVIRDYPSTIEILKHIANVQGYNKSPKGSKLLEIYNMNNLYN